MTARGTHPPPISEETRKKLSEAQRRNWSRPETRQNHIEALTKSWRGSDAEERRKRVFSGQGNKHRSEAAKKRWGTEEGRALLAQRRAEWNASEKIRSIRSETSTRNAKNLWNRPEWRQYHKESILPKMVAGWKASPKWRAAVVEAAHSPEHIQQIKDRWKDPEMRAKIIAASVAASKSKGTRIELLARDSLTKRGIHFQSNLFVEKISEVDLVIADERIAIFCDGCYWHDCPVHNSYKENRRLAHERDQRFTVAFKERGWTVLRFWEHEIKADPDIVGKTVERVLSETALPLFESATESENEGVERAYKSTLAWQEYS